MRDVSYPFLSPAASLLPFASSLLLLFSLFARSPAPRRGPDLRAPRGGVISCKRCVRPRAERDETAGDTAGGEGVARAWGSEDARGWDEARRVLGEGGQSFPQRAKEGGGKRRMAQCRLSNATASPEHHSHAALNTHATRPPSLSPSIPFSSIRPFLLCGALALQKRACAYVPDLGRFAKASTRNALCECVCVCVSLRACIFLLTASSSGAVRRFWVCPARRGSP